MSLNTNDSNITVVFLRLHLGKQEPLKIGKVSSSYLSIDRGKARTDRLPQTAAALTSRRLTFAPNLLVMSQFRESVLLNSLFCRTVKKKELRDSLATIGKKAICGHSTADYYPLLLSLLS